MSNVMVSALHVYPLKSARGIALRRAEVGARGPLHDRSFMVVDPTGRFLTQRELPRMALLATSIGERTLEIAAPGVEPLVVPLAPEGGAPRRVRVWNDQCAAEAVGDEATRWLSHALGRPCELVYLPPGSVRPVAPAYAPEGAQVGFADGFPFLLLSAASLAEVARRGADVPMDRFRPNIVVDGCEPFAEDGWRTIRIGAVRFLVAKPCERCAIPTVDQRTAEVGREPMRTLASFRTVDGKVLFGQNLVQLGRGVVSVGDELTVEERAARS